MRKPPLIILGDYSTIRMLGKAPLRNHSDWSQMDSDIMAHFIQVHRQICDSRWYKSEISFATQADQLLEYSFPDFEDFVFAAVYVRQLIAKKDSLLKDAIERYCHFVDCNIRPAWVRHELSAFNSALDRKTLMLPQNTLRELFDAFMYGAGLMHKIPDVKDPKRRRFLEIYDQEPRYRLLYELNTSFKILMNHVGNVAMTIYRGYSNWLHDYQLPAPDTRWHDRLFKIKSK